MGHGAVQGGRLAFRRAAGEAPDVREDRGHPLADRRRGIVGSVFHEEDFLELARILEAIRTAKGPFDHNLLVPCRDDEADDRQVDRVPQRSLVERLRAASRHPEAEEDEDRVVAGDRIEDEREPHQKGCRKLAPHPPRIGRST